MILTARKIGRYHYVTNQHYGEVAIMERSPFTGEFCYGLRTEQLGRFGSPLYQSPVIPTRRKSVKAALRQIHIALQEG